MKASFLLVLAASSLCVAQQRYADSLFAVQQTDTNLVYATAPQLQSPYAGESATQSTSLKMHVFQPAGDTEQERPMLLCFHGGAFVSGNKEHDDMLAFCRTFAAKGYVTATVQYRLGMNATSAVSGTRSVYRALQDGRAAIRYAKAHASTFGIDTSRVFMLGSSAGAFIGLQAIYMNTSAEKPAAAGHISHMPPTLDDGPDLGGLDAIESSLTGFGQPAAVISLWGAVQDTVLITPTDVTPVLLVHGTADNIVPFGVGSPFNLTSLPATYGSSPIHERLMNLGFPHETYFVPGEGHEFYGVSNGMWNPAPNAYWDTVVTRVTEFLLPKVTSVKEAYSNDIPGMFVLDQNFPNPFNPSTRISFQLPIASHVSLAVYDLLGREVDVLLDSRMPAGAHTAVWNAARMPTGMYLCKLTATALDGSTASGIRRMVLLR